MDPIKGPEEVYRKYLDQFGFDGDGDPDAIALFTFSLVERDRFDWMEHHRAQHNGVSPTLGEIERWYTSKPPSYFEDKYRHALSWYRAFAKNLLEEEINKRVQDSIKEYIGDKLSFLPQLYNNLTGNIIFILFIGLVALFVFADFSPIEWIKLHITKQHS